MHNSSPGNGGEMASHHTLRQIGESPPLMSVLVITLAASTRRAGWWTVLYK